MALYQIPLPNGQTVEFEGPEGKEREARLKARQYFQETDPEGFAKWNESRPLQGFGESFVTQGRGALGSQIQGAAPYAAQLGLPGEQTLRDVGKAVSGEESLDTRGFEGFSDLARQFVARPLETTKAAAGTALGAVAGSVAAPVAAGLAAAGLGAGAPLAAGLGLGTAIVTGAFSSTNELEGLLKQEGLNDDMVRRLSVGVGGLIGAGEGGAAGALISRALGRGLKRETIQQLLEMSNRSVATAAAKGTLAGIALEGGSEALGSAARETTAALASGNYDVANRADRVLLDAALGSLGGGAVAGVGGSRDPARARAELEQRAGYGPQLTPGGQEAPSPPAPEPPPAPAGFPEGYFSLPQAPAPIADVAIARDFLAQNRPDVRALDISDEAAVAQANYLQNMYYETELSKRRAGAVDNFLGVKAIREIEEPGATEEDAPTVRQVRDVQADQFITRLVEAAAVPADPADPAGPKKIDLGNFTARQIQDLALEPFGEEGRLLSTAPEQEARRTAEERGKIRRELDALRDEGFLMPGLGKNSYALAPGAIAEPCAVGLSNRCRGHGDRFEGREESLERIFEFRLDGRLDGLRGIRRDVGLEHLQLGGLGAAD